MVALALPSGGGLRQYLYIVYVQIVVCRTLGWLYIKTFLEAVLFPPLLSANRERITEEKST